MYIPDLYGNEYLGRLQEYRDKSLVESYWRGRRHRIGKFTCGLVQAKWLAEDGMVAHLTDQGWRFNNVTLSFNYPTTLYIYDAFKSADIEFTTFEMDIDDSGRIEVYHNMLKDGSFRGILRADMAKRAVRQSGQSEPLRDDCIRLYSELQRGASGVYSVANLLRD
jgi:hypothetical protein